MATAAARIKAIGDALINGIATTEQLSRLGRGIAARRGRLTEYDEATQAVKAVIAVEEVRRHLIELVREFEAGAAAAAVSSEIDSAFTEL